MKYHSLLISNPGLNTLPINPCKLLDFNLLKLSAGETHTANSGGREILAVMLGGKATFEINGQRFDWKERDIFCVPSWAWHEHHNVSETEDACLFNFNDLPVIEGLGLYQSRELEENNGHQKID